MELIISTVALGISLVAIVIVILFYRKTKRILTVENKDSIIALLEKHFGDIEGFREMHSALLVELKKIGAMAYNSAQKMGFLRYNPFKDTGGDQSFSICMLDGRDNGFTLTSLYGREGTRIYSKQIRKGVAEHTLSEEEKRVLEEALASEIK